VDTTTRILAVGAAACAIAALLVLVRLHLLPGGRATPPGAVSDYGVGPYHRYYRALVLLLGVGAALLVAALGRGSEAGDRALVFLGAFAAARIAIAFFMTDPPGSAVTTTGRVHVLLAAVAFTAIAFGAADATSAIENTPGWIGGPGNALRVASDAVGVTAFLTLAAYLVRQARERAFGIAERLLYLAGIAWLLVVSIHLATLAGGG
jgi:hypothetical protein